MSKTTMSSHFSPPTGWMNDPNGLIYHNGRYHLFYQHNPFTNEFGNISWGHAVSKDLQNWEHLPVALAASEGKMIYSGCVVFDEQNSFGHKDGPALVAIYTEHLNESETVYEQKIAYATSHDEGLTWDMSHPERLVHPSSKDFRDPKAFWHAPTQKWVIMVTLSLEYTIEFYESVDLKNWSKTGSFSADAPINHSWECPDLFPLTDEQGHERWVLTLSGDHPDGRGWGMFYFIGEFDGKVFSISSPSESLEEDSDDHAFTAQDASGASVRDPEGGKKETSKRRESSKENPQLERRTESSSGDSGLHGSSESSSSDSEGDPQHHVHHWLNYGYDFYAGITFEGMEERIMMGWCGNWAYAQDLSKHGLTSKMSLPRSLSLKNGILCQEPVTSTVPFFNGSVNSEMQFELGDENRRKALLTISPKGVKIDRSAVKAFADHPEYQVLEYHIDIELAQVFENQGILELFLNEGHLVITEQF